MPDEGFLRRWSRRKAEGPGAAEPAAAPAVAEPRSPAAPAVVPHPAREDALPAPVLPTLDDVARLDASSDFSAFMTQGVDKHVRRLAMKKLFSDPHFNLVDRLDVYMDDFNKPSPVSAEMLAALQHTKNLFAPLLADKEAEAGAATAGGAADPANTAAVAGADAASTQSSSAGEPATATNPGGNAADAADTADSNDSDDSDGHPLPAPPEPMPFHVAAPGGVLQQTQQGKA